MEIERESLFGRESDEPRVCDSEREKRKRER
jgi:hypothetical protein